MTHELIHTPNYLLVVDDSEIKEGDFCLADIVASDFYGVVKYNGAFAKHYYKKIIAHLLLNNSPILEGVDLLPPLEQEDDVEKLAIKYTAKLSYGGLNASRDAECFIWTNGYNKAKEKYKYTEEDVKKIVEKSRETGLTAEYLMLSLSQPKYPTEFECEIHDTAVGDINTGKLLKWKPKTTTNSQGQTVLIGRYLYQ